MRILRSAQNDEVGTLRMTERKRGAGPGGRMLSGPYEKTSWAWGRGGLWPPGDPRRDPHRLGGGEIELLPFPVPSA